MSVYNYRTDILNEYILEDNLRVRIEKVNDDIAAVYFVESTGTKLRVPNNTQLRETRDKTTQKPLNETFYITWIGEYSLFREGIEFLSFSNKREHSVNSDKIMKYRLYNADGEVIQQSFVC